MSKRKIVHPKTKELEKVTALWSDYLGFPFSTAEVSDMLKMADICNWRSSRTDKPEPKEIKLFWNLLDTMGEEELNHSNDPSLIAINLVEFLSSCRSKGHRPPDLQILKQRLPDSVRHPLVEKSRVIQSNLKKQSTRCWVFQR